MINPLFTIYIQGILNQKGVMQNLPNQSLISLTVYHEYMTIINMDIQSPSTKKMRINFNELQYSIKWKFKDRELIGFNLYTETISDRGFKLLKAKGTQEILMKLKEFFCGRVAFRNIDAKFQMINKVKTTKNSQIILVVEDNEKKILKIIPKNHGHSEMSILKQLFFNPHPNLLTLTSYYLQQQSYYVMMNYCQYGTLYSIFEVYNGRSIPKQIIKNIMKQILEGIQHLHSCGIIHRDIKLDNILFSKQDEIVIIDYGFSIQEDQEIDQQAGTVGYMAPDVFYGEGITNKVDIFSAGVVFHILLSQSPLFSTLEQNQQCIVQIHHSITDSLELDLLKGMLHKDPKNRFSALDCLAHPFFIDEEIQDSGLNLFFIKEKRKNQLTCNKVQTITSMPRHKPRYSMSSHLSTHVNLIF